MEEMRSAGGMLIAICPIGAPANVHTDAQEV